MGGDISNQCLQHVLFNERNFAADASQWRRNDHQYGVDRWNGRRWWRIAYTTAKHAIVGFTKQLALDVADQGISVKGIAPGAIQTPMNAADFAGDGKMAQWVAEETPVKRWAQPEEVAALTLFLASPQASYLQGAIVPIDGGWTLK